MYAGLKDLFSGHLEDDEDVEEFARWAFGARYRQMYMGQLMDAWNYLHGQDLILEPIIPISEDAPSMIMLWRKSLA